MTTRPSGKSECLIEGIGVVRFYIVSMINRINDDIDPRNLYNIRSPHGPPRFPTRTTVGLKCLSKEPTLERATLSELPLQV